MRAIFISYRRDDSEGQAGRLFEALCRQFGKDAVFMDVAAIEPGRDFRRVIDQQVAACGVLLAVIGRNWLDAVDESGTRRLDDPQDFVRLETVAALRRDIPVVPVLVHGARMPRAEQLPDEMKDFAFRNAIELTHARWESDVQVLVRALRPYAQPLQMPDGAGRTDTAQSGGMRRPVALAGAAVVLVVLGGIAVLQFGASSPVSQAGPELKPPDQASDSQKAGGTEMPASTAAAAAAVNLKGRWPASECDLIIDKDDGTTVGGVCDTGMEHRFEGRYVSSDKVDIRITRIDNKTPCTMTVAGTIRIISADIIEFSQEGWDGCNGTVKTGPVSVLLKRG